MYKTTTLLSILVLISIGQPSLAIQKGDWASLKRETAEYSQKLMRKKSLKGISIALVDDETLVFSDGYGWADEKKKIPADTDTVYQVGAISKIFTALAVMKLWERGIISLDVPFRRYVPEFLIGSRFPRAKPLTLRTLLTEHSGLPSEILKNTYTITRPVPFNDYMEKTFAYLREDYLCAPPDTVYANCNLGYALLGWLVQKQTGESFVTYTGRELFRAMGMPRTTFSPDRTYANLAKGYVNGRETPLLYVNDLPAMSAYSSVEEMANFIKAILAHGSFGGERIIRPRTLKAMMEPQNLRAEFDADFKIGLGWQLDGYDLIYSERLHYSGPVIWRAGNTVIHSAILMILPREKLGVVVLCNTGGAMRELGNIALRCMNLALEAKTGSLMRREKEPAAPEITLSPKRMKSLEGYFASEYIGFISIRSTGEHLVMNVMDRDIRLIPHADGSFTLKYYLFGFIPLNIEILADIRFTIDDIRGKTALILLKDGKKYFGGMKIDRPELPPIWKLRVGKYQIMDQGDDVILFREPRIILKDGFLIFKADYAYLKNASIMLPLRPLSSSECVVMGLGRFMGQTAKFTQSNGKIRFSFSGLTLEKIEPN
ncbi:MAG: hypothetical protein A2W19_12580 [Spirochaetes bacterium RBG_16_49_21]|nr:MAG: hypothetical protein A2W19_12580 [Spirochaetes bacterium RBG_16_49_21]